MSSSNEQQGTDYGRLIAVWAGLLLLTALTVWVSRLRLPGIHHIWGALLIATLKAGLVITFFMRMYHETRLLRWFLFVVLLTLTIFIGLTFFDILYR